MTEALELGLKCLNERSNNIHDGLGMLSKVQAKATSDMNHTLDMIVEMREKVQALLQRQDRISKQFKDVDKQLLQKGASDYTYKRDAVAPIKRKPKSTSPEPDRALSKNVVTFQNSSDDEYKPEPRESEPMKFDELSDDEVKADDIPDKHESGVTLSDEEELEREREKAKAVAQQMEDEFEEDERKLEEGHDDESTDPADEEEALRKEEEEEGESSQMEEEERLRIEEEEALLKEEEEIARLEAEEAELAKAEEEELARQLAEEELHRLEEEELAKEEEELRRLEEEEKRLLEEEEANRLKEEEEAERKKKEEEEASKKAGGKFPGLKSKPGGPGKITNKFGGGKNKVVFK